MALVEFTYTHPSVNGNPDNFRKVMEELTRFKRISFHGNIITPTGVDETTTYFKESSVSLRTWGLSSGICRLGWQPVDWELTEEMIDNALIKVGLKQAELIFTFNIEDLL